MTSGQFKPFPVDKIFVDRETRQRREISEKQIQELAASIARSGLINPPTIHHSGELVTGERRWRAVKSLGWTSVPVQFIEDLPPDEVHLIELEENVRRVNLTWQEECAAIEEYHRLRATEDPEWTKTKTAETLGIDRSEVQQKLAVAKEIASGNERVAQAPKYSTARGIVQRTAERKRDAALAEIEDRPEAPEIPLIHADFHKWSAEYTGPKFNLIHCDFPYGVNADKHNQGAAKSFGGYEDSTDIYFALLDTLESSMSNVIADSAHLIFWFSLDYYELTRQRLTDMGWKVNPFPLIWYKSDNTGILPDSQRGPRRVYETAFFASRGDRKIISAVSNVFAGAGREKSVHMSEKSRALLTHFLRMVCDEYSYFLDPTCGSGNAVYVAESLGASRVLGLEANEEFYNLAKENYHEI